jgi:hypothetical protein
MGAVEPSRVPPSRVALFLLAMDVLVLVPLGVGLVWLGAVAPEPHWNDLARVMVVAMGMAAVVLFTFVGLGIIRYNVLGIPSVRLTSDGVTIGGSLVAWDQVGQVGVQNLYEVPYLTVELDRTSLDRVAWIDRLAMKFAAPPDDRRGPLWITEQQLGMRAQTAWDLVPPGHAGR